MYDYVIVGCGLFGITFSRFMTDHGKKCLIIDKRNHIGGNCYTENIEGIHVHKYGPHIFHTNDDGIWDWVNKFSSFNHFRYNPKVHYKGKLYDFPINLFSLYQVWGVKTPEEARQKLNEVKISNKNPSNLEEYILSQVGEEIYNIFIKGYTTKQWMRNPKELPTFIIKRLPIRLTFDNNYYFDKYQGIPVGGYTKMMENMLRGIEVKKNVDYFENKEYWNSISKRIIFTGSIDQFFDYRFGELEYRTLIFEEEFLNISDYQGCAGINYSDIEIPYTRIIEHKHFEFGTQQHTIITREYPDVYSKNKIPYYPINDDKNNTMYKKYKELASQEKKILFGGRLSDYQYYDMHQIIGSALVKAKMELNKISQNA